MICLNELYTFLEQRGFEIDLYRCESVKLGDSIVQTSYPLIFDDLDRYPDPVLHAKGEDISVTAFNISPDIELERAETDPKIIKRTEYRAGSVDDLKRFEDEGLIIEFCGEPAMNVFESDEDSPKTHFDAARALIGLGQPIETLRGVRNETFRSLEDLKSSMSDTND